VSEEPRRSSRIDRDGFIRLAEPRCHGPHSLSRPADVWHDLMYINCAALPNVIGGPSSNFTGAGLRCWDEQSDHFVAWIARRRRPEVG
jgi:hypothetical protein